MHKSVSYCFCLKNKNKIRKKERKKEVAIVEVHAKSQHHPTTNSKVYAQSTSTTIVGVRINQKRDIRKKRQWQS